MRLLSTDGFDSGFGTGHVHVEAVLSRLAVAELDGADHLDRLLGAPPPGGAVAAVVTRGVPVDDLERLGRLAGRSGGLTVVVVDGTGSRPPGIGAALVRVTPDSPFPAAWDAALRSAGARPAARR